MTKAAHVESEIVTPAGSNDLEANVLEVARGGGITFPSLVIGKTLNLVLLVVLGRILGAESYGHYALGLGLLQLTQALTTLGISAGVLRFASIYHQEDDQSRLKGLLFSSIFIVVITSIVMTALLYSMADSIAGLLGDQTMAPVTRWFALSLPFMSLLEVGLSYLLSIRRIVYQAIVRDLVRPGLTVCFVVVLIFIGPGILRVIGVTTLAYALTAVIALWLIFRSLPSNIWHKAATFDTVELLRYSLPLVFARLLYFSLSNTDRLMIGYFGTAVDVGLYAAGAMIAAQLVLIHHSLLALFSPIIASLHHQKQHTVMNGLYRIVTRWDISLSVIGAVVVSQFSTEILGLYGSEFTHGVPTLQILLLAYVISAAAGPSGMLLRMTGHQNKDLVNAMILIAVNVFLNLLLIPRLGVVGAAIATVLAYALLNVMQIVQIRNALNMYPMTRESVVLNSVILICGICLVAILVNTATVIRIFATTIYGLVVLFILVWRSSEQEVVVFQRVTARFRRTVGIGPR